MIIVLPLPNGGALAVHPDDILRIERREVVDARDEKHVAVFVRLHSDTQERRLGPEADFHVIVCEVAAAVYGRETERRRVAPESEGR